MPTWICSLSTTAHAVCPAGKYASEDGKLCLLCGLHTYTDKNASVDCKSCPKNSRTVVLGASSRTECQCIKDTFALNYSDSECKACPRFAKHGGWNIPKALPGFWRASECSSKKNATRFFSAVHDGLSRLTDNCTLGYQGPLCGRCDRGYFRLNKCPDVSLNMEYTNSWLVGSAAHKLMNCL